MYKTTHCSKGHLRTPENTYINKAVNYLICRECQRVHVRNHFIKMREANRVLADVSKLQRKCCACELVKPMDEFSRDVNKKYGRTYICTACRNIKESIRTKLGKHEEYRKRKLATDPEYRKKDESRRRFKSAVRAGKIERKPCEVCGSSKSQGHHEDYDKPLEVIWLCAKHHMERHRKYPTSVSR